MTILYLSIAAGVTALAFALVLALNVLRQDQGSETIQQRELTQRESARHPTESATQNLRRA